MDNNIRISTTSDLSGVNAVRSGLVEIRNLAAEISRNGIQMPTSVGQSYQGSQAVNDRMRQFHEQATASMPRNQAPGNGGYRMHNGVYVPNSSQSAPNGAQVGSWMEMNLPVIEMMMGRMGTPNTNSSGGNGPSSNLPRNPRSNSRPRTPGEAFRNSFQRRHANSSWSAEGLASTAGTVLGAASTPMVIGAAIVGAVVDSFNKYMNSGDSLSGLTKQILSTRDSLESLQKTILPTGAAMAMSADMTAKVANTLGTAYGSMSLSTLNSRIAQVGGMGLAYGVSPDALAQGFAGTAKLGITTGPGSTMGQGQFAFGLANSAAQSGMSGRMEELMQEILTVTQSIQSTSVTSNPTTLLGIITAMNANLPRSMQGQGGAAVLGQISSSISNPNGLQQLINYQAMSGAGVNNYFKIMRSQQMGLGYALPNGKTSAQAIFGQYNKLFGGNPDEESYFLSKGLGISMPQADEMMKIFGPKGVGMSSIQNHLGINPNQLKDTDWSKLALLGKLEAAKSGEDLSSVQNDFIANGGNLTEDQKTALTRGNLDQQKKRLAQDILGGKYNTKTTTEQVNTLNATVTNAQITVTGSITSSVANSGNSNNNPVNNNPINSARNGPGASATSYERNAGITTGGYSYSNAVVATAMGMNGMNNAFTWLSAKGSGKGNGVQVSYQGKTGIPYSSGASTGNGVKDFMTNMYSYANDASNATGLPTSFILAQWGLESASGTSQAAIQNNNFAGIKPFGGLKAGKDSTYAGFDSINDFVKAYDNTINSSRYAGARSAASNGASAKAIGDLLHQEGYAEDSNYGAGIQGYVNSEANALNLSDATLAKLSQAIANAIMANGNGHKADPYFNA